MMNYAAAYGTLEGKILALIWQCDFSTKPLSNKELATRLQTILTAAKERGENYDREHNEYGNRK